MANLTLPDDLQKLGVIFVDRDSPACKALIRMCGRGRPRPGEIFPISREELNSLKVDAVTIDLPKKVANG